MTNRRFSVAPMMDWTDRHCRFLMRLISRDALLYTEMVTTGALLHGDVPQHLDYSAEEHPLALQLGGSDPGELAQCTKIAGQWNYDEVNLNCGCPSDRVQSGQFGASLMKQPDRVRDCLKAMLDAADMDITLKCRIGVDDMEGYEPFAEFIDTVTDSGCRTIIVHARKAWLQGLSPKQNREIPPLHYEYVYRLKKDFPDLEIILNGGIESLEEGKTHLDHVDGIMMGRAAYQNPYILKDVDALFFEAAPGDIDRESVCRLYIEYCEAQLNAGCKLHHMSRHLLGLYQNLPGARKFRRHISEHAHEENAGPEVLHQALACIM